MRREKWYSPSASLLADYLASIYRSQQKKTVFLLPNLTIYIKSMQILKNIVHHTLVRKTKQSTRVVHTKITELLKILLARKLLSTNSVVMETTENSKML